MADPSGEKMMVYQTYPAPNKHWDPSVRKNGAKAAGGQWRGMSILPEHLPRGPKLNFGSRRVPPGFEALDCTSPAPRRARKKN
jgi:hypothetical protein